MTVRRLTDRLDSGKIGLAMRADLRFIRFVVSSLAAWVALTAGCSSVRWERSFESGMDKAIRQQRPALVQFYAPLNGDCLEMDRTVFTNPDVQKRLEDFVPIRLDYYLNRELADQLGVATLPAFFIFRCDRSIAGSHAGKMDADKFSFFLIRYRYY